MDRWMVLQAAHGEVVRAAVERPVAGLALTDPGAVPAWARFRRQDEGDARVSLRAANGRFLCAEFGGGTMVLANRPTVQGAWERFTPSDNPDGTISLRAHNGKLLRAVGGGGDVIMADGDVLGDETKFTLTTLDDGTVTLKTKSGHYLTVERSDGGRLVANRDALRDSQTFAVNDILVKDANGKDVPTGKVSLKASNQQFVRDARDEDNRMVADRGVVGDWEQFTLIRPKVDAATLQASSGRYVCSDYHKKGDLYADRGTAGGWETFKDVAGWERPRPKKLLIYYGWPSAINDVVSATPNLNRAAGQYAGYDYVVLGRRVEEDKHADRANTIEIIKRVADLSQGVTRFFGYVPMGKAKDDEKLSDGTPDRATGQQYTDQQIADRIRLWQGVGVHGVLLDEFGFDLGNDRHRQNAAVEVAHENDLAVIANGWEPDEVFGVSDKTETKLRASDFYLCESWQLTTRTADGYAEAEHWKNKANLVRAHQKRLQFRVLSVTTTTATTFRQSDLDYAWYSALLYGHEAFGWGELEFSGHGDMANKAPLHPRPTLCADAFTSTEITVSGTKYSRLTDKGTVEVDTTAHTGKFTPKDPAPRS